MRISDWSSDVCSSDLLGVALQIGFLRLTGTALNSFEIIPGQVLAHLGIVLDIEVPQLTSIRALYRRRRTLFEHQDSAKRALGLRDLALHGEWALGGFLRREAGVRLDRDELVGAARDWLVQHNYLQLPQRRLTGLAAAARRRSEAELLSLAVRKAGKVQSEAWTLPAAEGDAERSNPDGMAAYRPGIA